MSPNNNSKPGMATILGGPLDQQGIGTYTIMGTSDHPPLYELAVAFQKEHPNSPIEAKPHVSVLSNMVLPRIDETEKLHIEFRMAARLLPEAAAIKLHEDVTNGRVQISVSDGMGSKYDPVNAIIEVKGAYDFIHEIGHHAWNSWLIGTNEWEKKNSVNNSLPDPWGPRKRLPATLIPNAHASYAAIVGAYNGQFLEDPDNTTTDRRMNDLEEHFARNFDLLARGRPLEVTIKSDAAVDNMLDFYESQDIIGVADRSLFKYIIEHNHGGVQLNVVEDLSRAQDGIPIKRTELVIYHKNRLEHERGTPLSNAEIIGLSLDLTPTFIQYCIDNSGFNKVQEAMRQKKVM